MGFMALSMLVCFITIIGIATKQRDTGKQAFIVPNLKEVCVLQTGNRCFYHPGAYVDSCMLTECASWEKELSLDENGMLQITRIEQRQKITVPEHSLCGDGKWCSGGECVAIPERQPRPEKTKLTPEWKEGILCLKFGTEQIKDEIIGRYFGQDSIYEGSRVGCHEPMRNRAVFNLIPYYCEGMQSRPPNELCEYSDKEKYSLIITGVAACSTVLYTGNAFRKQASAILKGLNETDRLHVLCSVLQVIDRRSE
ncbi:hypothetical protein TTRE_0000649501 [Trichuris trichiura]|uniref:Uncharacterized protein n=1 Tax=Trichuris trichiura TaxID=36087 RepID=A0A077ZHW6_TRITR|nr:hypothetical protein TTRE_0000649501 [Trichuris trichiura]